MHPDEDDWPEFNRCGLWPGNQSQGHSADVLQIVITADHSCFSTLLDDAAERYDHSIGRQRKIDFYFSTLSVRVIDYVDRRIICSSAS